MITASSSRLFKELHTDDNDDNDDVHDHEEQEGGEPVRPLELQVRLPLLRNQLAPQRVVGQEPKLAAALKTPNR